jgi:hypothetical protein
MRTEEGKDEQLLGYALRRFVLSVIYTSAQLAER